MSSTATAAAATEVTAPCVDSAESIVQSINDLREEQCLIDIQIEVCAAVIHLYTLSMQASLGKVFGAHKVVLAARFPGLKSLLTQQSELSRTTINVTRYSEE